MTLTLAYAILKGVHLINRENPTINEYPAEDHFHISETVNLNEIGFRFAFSYRRYGSGPSSHELIDNPDYVKYIVRYTGKRNGTGFEEILPYHKCTDADYAGFYPPAKNSLDDLKEIREEPKKNLFCLD